MPTSVPKAVLYYGPRSVWSAVALLTLAEKGYGEDEVDLKPVDLSNGENFAPSFLRLNPKATVPTLIVPLQKTLSADVESRYKAITDTKSIVEFLDKSRSATSHTSTTSSAPAPALAPATIAYASLSTKLIDEVLHAEAASPNTLFHMNARDLPSLRTHAKAILPFLQGRDKALDALLAGAGETHVSEKTKAFWAEKRAANGVLLAVYADAEKDDAELDADAKTKRDAFFTSATLAWTGAREALTVLSKEVIGPYALGEQISLADMHLMAWLARVALLAGCSSTDDGATVVAKLEQHVGDGFSLPRDVTVQSEGARQDTPKPPSHQARLAVYWDTVKTRPSWEKVYGEGLR